MEKADKISGINFHPSEPPSTRGKAREEKKKTEGWAEEPSHREKLQGDRPGQPIVLHGSAKLGVLGAEESRAPKRKIEKSKAYDEQIEQVHEKGLDKYPAGPPKYLPIPRQGEIAQKEKGGLAVGRYDCECELSGRYLIY